MTVERPNWHDIIGTISLARYHRHEGWRYKKSWEDTSFAVTPQDLNFFGWRWLIRGLLVKSQAETGIYVFQVRSADGTVSHTALNWTRGPVSTSCNAL